MQKNILYLKKMIFQIFYFSNDNLFKHLSSALLLKKSDYKTLIKNFTKEEEKSGEGDFDEDWILCIICKNKITQNLNKIEINSNHTHTFLNPHGLFFNIRCFKSAPGCETFSKPTEEYTWFPGFTWQVVVCSNCKIHNGWKYSSGSSSFFGLIENTLIYKN